MNKRTISFLLALTMLLPFGSALAASTMGDVHVSAHTGQTITLTTTAFTDALDLDADDEDVTLYHISFPTLPPADQAVIRLDGANYVADTPVSIAEIDAGDLQVQVTAQSATVQIPFHATLSNDEVLHANLIITV